MEIKYYMFQYLLLTNLSCIIKLKFYLRSLENFWLRPTRLYKEQL